MPNLLLGLIGDNIAASSAPLLHRLAGEYCGIDVEYRRLVPAALNMSLPEILDACEAQGFAGVNITYPYKEAAMEFVRVEDPQVRSLGAVNTVLFGGTALQGFNTDHTGFMAVHRAAFGGIATGPVGIVGAGGVGRAIAFALAKTGTQQIRLLDQDNNRSSGLRDDLTSAYGGREVLVCEDENRFAAGLTGVINATPVGMHGLPGLPMARECIIKADWAFDAVYTPAETEFLQVSRAAGLTAISGFELFLRQGIDAWALFSGQSVPEVALRVPLEKAVLGKAGG